MATWIEAFKPVKKLLIPELGVIFRDKSEKVSPAQRDLATNLLETYAAADVDQLAELMLDAQPKQFADLFDEFKAHGDKAKEKMLATLAIKPQSSSNEILSRQQANAAAALVRFGEREKIFSALRIIDDPESLTQIVHRCRAEGVTTYELLDCLQIVDRDRQRLVGEPRKIEDRVLFGLLLALGEFTLEDIASEKQKATIEQVANWFRNDPSSTIHGATGWLLRQWKETDLVSVVDQTPVPYDPMREWFTLVIAAGEQKFYQTYVVIAAGDYDIGSPNDERGRSDNEDRNQVRLTRPVAILDREVTRGEIDASGIVNLNVDQYSKTAEHPMAAPSWYDSVQFCRWLTERAGLAEADQAYADPASLDQAEFPFDVEVKLPKNWPLDLDKPGFRLPTEAEWEIAARNGMRTMYGFGADESLLERYGWYQVNSGRQTHVAKELRPNLGGLFDMHGNTYEWCHDWYGSYPIDALRSDPAGPEKGSNRVSRGGGWSSGAANCRVAYRRTDQPASRGNGIGLRLALVPFSPSKSSPASSETGSVGTEGVAEQRPEEP